MKQDFTITETELNQNPLLRKMRERFTCSGNMTIGEIMLHRAEKDLGGDATHTAVAPSAAASSAVSKHMPAIFQGNKRAMALSCAIIAICAVVLLAFIAPIFGNMTADAYNSDPVASELSNSDSAHEAPVAEEPKEMIPSSSYETARNAFQNAFGS